MAVARTADPEASILRKVQLDAPVPSLLVMVIRGVWSEVILCDFYSSTPVENTTCGTGTTQTPSVDISKSKTLSLVNTQAGGVTLF